MEHIDTLELRLSHERVRLANAKNAKEREMRAVWVAGIEKEIAAERGRLPDMSLDDLAKELS